MTILLIIYAIIVLEIYLFSIKIIFDWLDKETLRKRRLIQKELKIIEKVFKKER